jgi:hypothetical protein
VTPFDNHCFKLIIDSRYLNRHLVRFYLSEEISKSIKSFLYQRRAKFRLVWSTCTSYLLCMPPVRAHAPGAPLALSPSASSGGNRYAFIAPVPHRTVRSSCFPFAPRLKNKKPAKSCSKFVCHSARAELHTSDGSRDLRRPHRVWEE